MKNENSQTTYLRIATIQFPFIPVVVHPNHNTLSEPDGAINVWVVGNKNVPKISTLSSLLSDIDTTLLENLQSNYLKWLVSVIKDILYDICNTENPDIILFPEYSLPLEVPHMFSWDDIIGKDREKFISFLVDCLNIGWAGNAEICESGDDKIICTVKDKNYKNSVEMRIDREGEKAILTISDGRTYDLKVEKENGKLNIYGHPNELENALLKYSKKRCIVGGIGSVSLDGKQKKNKFVVINDGNFECGEKAVLSPYDLNGIEGGDGPFIHPLTLYPNGEKIDVLSMVYMCSDFIDSAVSGTLWSKVENELEDKGYKEQDIGIVFVPTFTTTTAEMQHGRAHAGRKWRIVVLGNCSFFGNTQTWFYPYKEEELRDGTTPPIEKGESACIVVDIPYPPVQMWQPKSKKIENENERIRKPEFGYRTYHIRFENDVDEDELNSIDVETENFLSMVNGRLNKGMIYAAITFLGDSNTDENNNSITAIETWKDLQESIANTIPDPLSTYKSIPSLTTPYLDKIIFIDNPYTIIVDILHGLIDDDEKIKRYLKEIKKHIELHEPKIMEHPLHLLLSQS